RSCSRRSAARPPRARPAPPARHTPPAARGRPPPQVEGVDRAVPGKPRVVVAAGGTAGHVVPAVAVADELRASGAEVSFLGTRERIEADLVPCAGYEVDFIKVRGIDLGNPVEAAEAGALGHAAGGARCPARATAG